MGHSEMLRTSVAHHVRGDPKRLLPVAASGKLADCYVIHALFLVL